MLSHIMHRKKTKSMCVLIYKWKLKTQSCIHKSREKNGGLRWKSMRRCRSKCGRLKLRRMKDLESWKHGVGLKPIIIYH